MIGAKLNVAALTRNLPCALPCLLRRQHHADANAGSISDLLETFARQIGKKSNGDRTRHIDISAESTANDDVRDVLRSDARLRQQQVGAGADR